MSQLNDSHSKVDRRLRFHERLHGPEVFREIFGQKQSAAGNWIVLYGRCNGQPYNRIGISIGRKFGNAVRRNRFKRICREAFRLSKHEQPMGWDWVIVPRLPKATGKPKNAKRTDQGAHQPPTNPLYRLTRQEVSLELSSLIKRVCKIRRANPASRLAEPTESVNDSKRTNDQAGQGD